MVVWMEIVILHPFQAAKLTLIANNSNSVIQIVKHVLIIALWPSVHMVVWMELVTLHLLQSAKQTLTVKNMNSVLLNKVNVLINVPLWDVCINVRKELVFLFQDVKQILNANHTNYVWKTLENALIDAQPWNVSMDVKKESVCHPNLNAQKTVNVNLIKYARMRNVYWSHSMSVLLLNVAQELTVKKDNVYLMFKNVKWTKNVLIPKFV